MLEIHLRLWNTPSFEGLSCEEVTNALWLPILCKVPSKIFSCLCLYSVNGEYRKHLWIILEFFLRSVLVLCVLKGKIKHLSTYHCKEHVLFQNREMYVP